MSDLRTFDPRTGKYLGSAGRVVLLEATLTRPASGTAFTAGDHFGNGTPSATPLEFTTAALGVGLGGQVISAVAISSANQATKPNLRLYLFSGSPALVADNEPFNISDADAQMFLGAVMFNNWLVAGTGSGTAGAVMAAGSALTGQAVSIPYQCGTATKSLWGAVVEVGTYTPVASEQVTFRLGSKLD